MSKVVETASQHAVRFFFFYNGAAVNPLERNNITPLVHSAFFSQFKLKA